MDDYNYFETDEFIKKVRPDIFLSGLKDKYSVLKDGCASRQIHSYDYSGPYAGFHRRRELRPGHDHGPLLGGLAICESTVGNDPQPRRIFRR